MEKFFEFPAIAICSRTIVFAQLKSFHFFSNFRICFSPSLSFTHSPNSHFRISSINEMFPYYVEV